MWPIEHIRIVLKIIILLHVDGMIQNEYLRLNFIYFDVLIKILHASLDTNWTSKPLRLALLLLDVGKEFLQLR